MTAEQHQIAADPWTKLTDLSHWPACRKLHPPSPSVITQPENCMTGPTHFTIPQRVEG